MGTKPSRGPVKTLILLLGILWIFGAIVFFVILGFSVYETTKHWESFLNLLIDLLWIILLFSAGIFGIVIYGLRNYKNSKREKRNAYIFLGLLTGLFLYSVVSQISDGALTFASDLLWYYYEQFVPSGAKGKITWSVFIAIMIVYTIVLFTLTCLYCICYLCIGVMNLSVARGSHGYSRLDEEKEQFSSENKRFSRFESPVWNISVGPPLDPKFNAKSVQPPSVDGSIQNYQSNTVASKKEEYLYEGDD